MLRRLLLPLRKSSVRYGVPLTVQSLQSALKDKRPDVRSLAASELAEIKDNASVPLITEAMKEEKDAQVAFNMAAALLWVHSAAGNKALVRICDDSSASEDLRLEAASRLVDARDFQCVPSLLGILQNTTNPSNKASALLTLAHVTQMPPSLLPSLHTALLASLQDRSSAVRQYAGERIAALGDKAAVPYLQTAIASESDESTRKRMEEFLKTLASEP